MIVNRKRAGIICNNKNFNPQNLIKVRFDLTG